MARIYNFMPGSIVAIPSLTFIPTGGAIIASGQRSDSLEWSAADVLTVWEQATGAAICSFDFGLHAQIQGGNYAIIQPGSFIVYDSNHDVISTGSGS